MLRLMAPEIRAMKVIPEPPPNTRSILEPTFSAPAIVSEGPISYSCGNCGLILLKDVLPTQVQAIVIKCGRCKSYNDTPS